MKWIVVVTWSIYHLVFAFAAQVRFFERVKLERQIKRLKAALPELDVAQQSTSAQQLKQLEKNLEVRFLASFMHEQCDDYRASCTKPLNPAPPSQPSVTPERGCLLDAVCHPLSTRAQVRLHTAAGGQPRGPGEPG